MKRFFSPSFIQFLLWHSYILPFSSLSLPFSAVRSLWSALRRVTMLLLLQQQLTSLPFFFSHLSLSFLFPYRGLRLAVCFVLISFLHAMSAIWYRFKRVVSQSVSLLLLVICSQSLSLRIWHCWLDNPRCTRRLLFFDKKGDKGEKKRATEKTEYLTHPEKMTFFLSLSLSFNFFVACLSFVKQTISPLAWS